MLRTADEQGAPWAYAMQRLHVCELELRVGRWAAAERAARRVGRLPGQPAPALAHVRAVPGPGRGRGRLGRRRPPLGRRGDRPRRRDGRAVGPVRGAARPRPRWRCSGTTPRRPCRTCSRCGSTAGSTASTTPASSPSPPTWSRRWSRPATWTPPSEVTERLAALGGRAGPPVGPGHRAAGRGDGAALGRQGGRLGDRRPARGGRRSRRAGPAVRRRAHPALPRPGAAPGPSVGRRARDAGDRGRRASTSSGPPAGRPTRGRSCPGSAPASRPVPGS